ncbi:MAG: hypothetical protein GY740_24990, partial [Gammaproteobacteria bacterium]|nr:hypothetical protein [Gammaproteobacteria bacterium]
YFRSDFESHCRLYCLEVADWVTILSYFLLGKAKELFYNEAAIVGGQDNLRYDVLEAKLCAMFEISHPISYWVTRFQERFWNRAGETLDTFVADLRLSSTKAFPNLLQESESFVYMQLHRCLSPREKEWCFHHNATTPNDILRVLEQKQQLEQEPDYSSLSAATSTQDATSNPVISSNSPFSSLSNSKAGAHSTGGMFVPRGRGGVLGESVRGRVGGSEGLGRGQGQGNCFHCGLFGHFSRSCPKLSAQNSGQGGVKAVSEEFHRPELSEADHWNDFVSKWRSEYAPSLSLSQAPGTLPFLGEGSARASVETRPNGRETRLNGRDAR